VYHATPMLYPLTLAALVLLAAALAAALLLSVRRQRNYHHTLDSLPVGLCTVTGDHRIEFWSREMARISGVDAAQAIAAGIDGLPEPWRQLLHESLNEGSGQVIKRPAEAEEDGGGNMRWVILHSSARGTSQRAILIEDISSYQQTQDEVLHRERLASIGRLAAGVAHEIGNPVTGIACIAQNLVELDRNEEVALSAEEILKQTARISRIVDSLVQFSHSGGISQTVDFRACNLADCVDEAIHLLSLDRSAHRDSFSNRCDRELLVLADNQLLLQVFVNLLDNARSASPAEGSVSVEAQLEADTVSVFVDNAGEPIPTAILQRVFEPFFTTKDVGDGTGLGLPLVRSMIEDMGGDIDIQSPGPAGDGTRVTLRLARAQYGPELVEAAI
jgi:signal transduction histidine kinase